MALYPVQRPALILCFNTMMTNQAKIGGAALVALLYTGCTGLTHQAGQTEIMKWPQGKKTAISITYDDGSINQFKKAIPVMNALELPGTFFIITGQIPGSSYQGRFIGRPVAEIIAETAKTATNKHNFFERASAVAFTGYKGGLAYHTQAGGRFEAGDTTAAYQVIYEAYNRIRKGELPSGSEQSNEVSEAAGITWDDLNTFADQGHEFGSHTVTHPYLAVLDEENMLYELEKSKEDILTHLGPAHTFSAEGPYGTEDPRAVEHINRLYPAARNRMPEPFLEELNRGNKTSPTRYADKEYVQWQRGAYTRTTLAEMKAWVDTATAQGNIWLVLVFHGIDGIGWEAVDSELLKTYFQYIKAENDAWVATFGDVARYMRERMDATVDTQMEDARVTVRLTHRLDTSKYAIPLTLKTYLPAALGTAGNTVKVRQGNKEQLVPTVQDTAGVYVQYAAHPNQAPIEITKP